MRAAVLDPGFGLDNLTIVSQPVPEPEPGEVLVRVKALSLNFRDWLLVGGIYNPKQTFPIIPCSDCAGVVEAIGAGVTNFRPGDRVVNLFMERWLAGPAEPAVFGGTRGAFDQSGVLAEYVTFDEHTLLPAPDYLSFEEAACLPCAGLTAWSAIETTGHVKPGDSVVVQGTGGVAVFAAQFTRMAGARLALLSSSNDKIAALSYLEPDLAINYTETPDWDRAIRREFAKDGADLIIEVGGEKTIERSLRAVRIGGTLALIGVLSGAIAPVNLPLVVMRQVRLQGVTVGSRQDMADMIRALSTHKVKPHIHQVFAFDDYRAAFEQMSKGGQIGKIVISMDGA